MARYIDADKLKDEYYELYHHGTLAVKSVLSVFVNLLDKTPTADVAEVKHGEWVQRLRPYEDEIHCTVCEAVFNVIDNCTEKFDYCPHCGAKMGGGKDGNL